MYCNKYKVILHDSFLCEECEDNPKVSTGYYNECKQLNKDYIMIGYIARDENRALYFHYTLPVRDENNKW